MDKPTGAGEALAKKLERIAEYPSITRIGVHGSPLSGLLRGAAALLTEQSRQQEALVRAHAALDAADLIMGAKLPVDVWSAWRREHRQALCDEALCDEAHATSARALLAALPQPQDTRR